jgi:hypothetical protein
MPETREGIQVGLLHMECENGWRIALRQISGNRQTRNGGSGARVEDGWLKAIDP